MFCFDKCLFPSFEVRRRGQAVVCRPCITFLGLGELVLEFQVEFIEVNNIFMSAS